MQFLELLTATYDNINANNYTGILFLDLTKAFDTVCHQILLAKLQHYGIRGPSHQLIKSFLERKQFVSINGVNSDLQHNSFGVPQGSTLGPILFLICINDLPNAVLGSTTLFADNTCLMLRNSNLLTVQNDLNSQASCLNKWCKSNKLTINPQKCHILTISPKSNKNVTDFFIKLDGTVISAENSVKYLGINLDLNLNFRKHIEVIENKLCRSLAILFKLKPVLPQNALLKLHYAMVHPYLIYG